MVRTGKYNDVCDIQATDQTGFVDVGEAIRNGFVPGSMNPDTMVYNDIEDPASIMPNATDIFDLYRKNDYVQGYKPSTPEADEPTQNG